MVNKLSIEIDTLVIDGHSKKDSEKIVESIRTSLQEFTHKNQPVADKRQNTSAGNVVIEYDSHDTPESIGRKIGNKINALVYNSDLTTQNQKHKTRNTK